MVGHIMISVVSVSSDESAGLYMIPMCRVLEFGLDARHSIRHSYCILVPVICGECTLCYLVVVVFVLTATTRHQVHSWTVIPSLIELGQAANVLLQARLSCLSILPISLAVIIC